MSFKITLLVCLALMCLIAGITYYLGKKVSNGLMKYIPVFSFGIGVLFFYIKLNLNSYYFNSFDSIFYMILIIIFLLLFSIALLEAVIIEIVENTKLFRKGFIVMRKAMKLVNVNKQ